MHMHMHSSKLCPTNSEDDVIPLCPSPWLFMYNFIDMKVVFGSVSRQYH